MLNALNYSDYIPALFLVFVWPTRIPCSPGVGPGVKDFHDGTFNFLRSIARELIPFAVFEPARVKPKLAHPTLAELPTQLTGNAFNRLGQYASSTGPWLSVALLPFLP